MKSIVLTRELSTIVDDKNYDYLNQWKWFTKIGRYGAYAVRWSTKDEHKNSKRYLIYMHRVILNLPNKSNKIKVDHIDNNSLNNQEFNLRKATQSQNMINWTRKKNNSGYRGVGYHIRDKVFLSRIQINGKLKHLGTFNNPIDAAKKYDEYAKIYHKEFANLNFNN